MRPLARAVTTAGLFVLASGCLFGSGVTSDWDDADARVTSADAQPIVAGREHAIQTKFTIAEAHEDVVAKLSYRTGTAVMLGLEGPDSGQDVKVVRAEAGHEIRDETWASFPRLEPGTYSFFAVADDDTAPMDVEFALGLYWDEA